MYDTWKEYGKNGLQKQKMHTNTKTSKIILLDSIRSMQNVWAIMRNCDGAWFEKIILCGYTPCLPRNDISKTALGSEKTVDWEYYSDSIAILKKLHQEWYKIYSVELDEQSKNYKDFFQRDDEKICLVMGNEIQWVKREILDMSHEIISIPMLWEKASLNVSVAAGIVMYAFVN
jgi:tRNA G18 (ribose-2'-O)-methylase SpoU